MSDLPLRARIAAAKALLEASPMSEYDDLPPAQQAHFQEAIEFLTRIEEGIDAGSGEQTGEPADGSVLGDGGEDVGDGGDVDGGGDEDGGRGGDREGVVGEQFRAEDRAGDEDSGATGAGERFRHAGDGGRFRRSDDHE